jgi:hypothetical protein
MAQRISPSTRTTMVMPIRPSAREIRPVSQKDTRIVSETAAITTTPAPQPAAPNRRASLA